MREWAPIVFRAVNFTNILPATGRSYILIMISATRFTDYDFSFGFIKDEAIRARMWMQGTVVKAVNMRV